MSNLQSEVLVERDFREIPASAVDQRLLRHRLSSLSSYLQFKRIIDVALSIASAPAVLIVIALASLAILIVMGRPIFFVQNRVGLNGRIFSMIKLRTMICGTPTRSATNSDDPRITWLGRYLRLSHIDELPQLWNVLIGDMSLIGPRPEQPELVAKYREAIPDFDLRHLVRPGLSGYAQVHFGYATTLEETRQKLNYDLLYLQYLSPRLDLAILLRTFSVFLDRRYVR